jgi:serine/threonine protein kinase
MTLDPEPLPPASETISEAIGTPTRLGRYEIQRLLGQGGFGRVFLAWDPELQRHVAIKILDRADDVESERISREARALAQLSDPGICPVHDVVWDGTHRFIVMGYVDGPSLAANLKRSKPAWRDALSLTAEVARAMQKAHLHGIIHRDLKPANILLASSGKPVITDFGLAHSFTDDNQKADSIGYAGTPAYSPPEQIRGPRNRIGPWSDVYSLGMVLYEMLTGILPFRASTLAETFDRVERGDPAPPSAYQVEIPRELDQLCTRAIAKDPGSRIQSMKELETEIRGLLATQSEERPKDVPNSVSRNTRSGETTQQRRPRIQAMSYVAGGLLLFAAVAFAIWMGLPHDSGAQSSATNNSSISVSSENGLGPGSAPSEPRQAIEWILQHGGRVQLASNKVIERAQDYSDDGPAIAYVDFAVARAGEIDDDAIMRSGLHLLPQISSLSLDETRITDRGVEYISQLESLRRLSLQDAPITDSSVPHFARLPRLSMLMVSRTELSSAGIAELVAQRRYDWLILDGLSLNAACADALAAANVGDLSLESTNVNDALVEHLVESKTLNRLSLSSTPITDACAPVLARSRVIRSLELDNTRISDAGLQSLAAMPQLESVRLDGTRITDEGIASLATLPNISTLELANTRITNESLKRLADCPKVMVLGLSNTSVSDEGLQHLAVLRNLWIVRLSGTRVTREGVEKLKADFSNRLSIEFK